MASKNNLQNEAVANASNQYVSDNTKAAQQNLSNYSSNPYREFKASQSTNDAYQYWQNTLANRPADYQSNYSNQINDVLNQIVNREDFSYDFNADPLYQQYKDQYTTQGKQAMKDTVAQASNLSGGYGNSYATTAGSQAYQSYLQELNNMIPQLYNQAMQKYQMDTDALNNKFNVLGSQEDREFGQWSTNMSNWQNDRAYGLNAYSTLWDQDFRENEFNANQWNNDRNYAYTSYRDSVGDDYNAYNNAYNAAYNAQNYDYQSNRDAVSDNQWQQTFDYQKERDKVADEQWAREFALKQANAAAKNSGKSGSGTTSKVEEVLNSANPKSPKLSSAGNDALDYVSRIMNNTYGAEGENAAFGNLYRMVNDGTITQDEFNKIYEYLGFSDDQIDPAQWQKYLRN